MEGEGGKLRLIAINYFIRQLIAINYFNRGFKN